MKEYIKKQIGNIKQFSFAEMTSNSSGKTSGSGTAGLYIVFIGGLTFLMGCIDKMFLNKDIDCLLYTSPSPRDRQKSRMPSSA